MRFGEELQQLSELLKVSAETILQVAGVRPEDRAQLDTLAQEVDVIADRLMKIGSRDEPCPSPADGGPSPGLFPRRLLGH